MKKQTITIKSINLIWQESRLFDGALYSNDVFQDEQDRCGVL